MPVRPATEATLTPASSGGNAGREVVAFVPPDRRREDARGAYATTVAALRQALTHVAACAELDDSAVRLILVNRVTVARGGTREVFRTDGDAGIVLLDGTREPRWLDVGTGSSAEIRQRLAEAAAEYFSAPRCRPAAGDPK